MRIKNRNTYFVVHQKVTQGLYIVVKSTHFIVSSLLFRQNIFVKNEV